MERAIAAINARDIDAYLACCTDDVSLRTPMAELTGEYRGAEGIKRFLVDVEDAVPDFRIGVRSVESVGASQVLAALHVTASGRTSGIPQDAQSANVYDLADGKISRVRIFLDRREALEAVGLAHAPLVLASASPQRRALLERLGVEFSVRAQDVEELDAGNPREVVLENALRKARAAREEGVGGTVLACDTVVALDGVVYGKPADEDAARTTLRALSGATHEVLGAIALITAGEERTGIASTEVTFRALDEELLGWYLERGEWRGRAGGYAIQGAGAVLVLSVRGDYENVVGLPLATLLEIYPQLLGPAKSVR